MKRIAHFAVFASAIVAAACAPQEIVVADVADVQDAGSDGPPPCTKNEDCDPSSFCEKPCDPQSTGVCVDRPTVCSSNDDPRCGCSGTSYWNDCLRQQAGEGKRGDLECVNNAAHCGPHQACPMNNSSCALLFFSPDLCGSPPSAKCWVVPFGCVGVPPSEHWMQCGPGGPSCAETCEAIRSGLPSFRANMGCH